MKRYRVALCGLILLIVLVMLNGCHAEYECTIQFQEGTEAEGMLELLIPLAEEDPEYREYKEIEGVRKSAPPVALQDGSTYRSIQWYSHLSDIRTNPGKTTLCFNAADEFLNLCETRQSFRIALVDSQGNLLQLSEEYPFQSGKQSYLVPPILQSGNQYGAAPVPVSADLFASDPGFDPMQDDEECALGSHCSSDYNTGTKMDWRGGCFQPLLPIIFSYIVPAKPDLSGLYLVRGIPEHTDKPGSVEAVL